MVSPMFMHAVASICLIHLLCSFQTFSLSDLVDRRDWAKVKETEIDHWMALEEREDDIEQLIGMGAPSYLVERAKIIQPDQITEESSPSAGSAIFEDNLAEWKKESLTEKWQEMFRLSGIPAKVLGGNGESVLVVAEQGVDDMLVLKRFVLEQQGVARFEWKNIAYHKDGTESVIEVEEEEPITSNDEL